MSYLIRSLTKNSIINNAKLPLSSIFISSRNSSFKSSETFHDLHQNVQIEKNPPEWIHVEAILPPKIVPKLNSDIGEGVLWKKPNVSKELSSPYIIYRNKNQMVPVYLKETHRGLRKITMIKKIDGDIWQLAKDLKNYLESKSDKQILMRVNELSSQIHVRGDYVQNVYDFLMEKKF